MLHTSTAVCARKIADAIRAICRFVSGEAARARGSLTSSYMYCSVMADLPTPPDPIMITRCTAGSASRGMALGLERPRPWRSPPSNYPDPEGPRGERAPSSR